VTRDAVAQLLTVFEAAYRIRYNKNHVDAWEGFLADVDDGDGKRAAQEIVRRHPKPPTLADILSAVADIRAERERFESPRPALTSGEKRSLEPRQQFALMRDMWATALEMTKQKVSIEEKTRLLTAMAEDRIREAQKT